MIVHFTTVHPREDSRIRSKEVASLAGVHDDVVLLVQDGLGDEFDKKGGYRVIDTGPRLRRISRMTVGAWRMIRAVTKLKPQVAHFHDPELLPWAVLLKLWGIKVVYDVHEDMPEQVKHNPGLPALAQKALPPLVRTVEWFGGRAVDGLVVVTPTIADRFPKQKTALVRNFPMLEELHTPGAIPMAERPLEFAYVGYISEVRNIFGMMQAVDCLADPAARLRLVGSFAIEETERAALAMPEWSRVNYDGWASREQVAHILANVRAGLVLLKPVEHETLTLPIKLFEYMAAGVPVISSNFPLWRSIVESAQCGLLVDPLDPQDIADAMQRIIDNPEEAQRMGERGRKAVEEKYNWAHEAAILQRFYTDRLGIPKGLVKAEAHP
jgi:hypothetical protein|tara:strand:- start:2938 stop:4083 length:1146 start_codon:yes stop_codon:yes gene_type:complete